MDFTFKILRKIGLISFVVIGLFFITGCSNKVKKVNVVKQYKYISLPKSYYKDDIKIAKLPNKKRYINATPIVRDKMNTKLIVNLYKNIGEYKNKLKAIESYENRVQDLINSKDMLNIKQLNEILKNNDEL